MISYLSLLVQFSPAAGRAGRCRQMSLCVGSTLRALAWQPRRAAWAARGLRALSPVRRALSLCGEWPGQPEVCAASSRVLRTSSFRGEARAARGLAHSPVARRAFSLSGPRARRCRSGLRKSLTASGVFQPVNFSALPQFKKRLPLLSGPSGRSLP